MKPIVEPIFIHAATWPARISRSLILELLSIAGFALFALRVWWAL